MTSASYSRYLRRAGIANSVTRFGDLLYFGQLFKARGNKYSAEMGNTFSAIFVKV